MRARALERDRAAREPTAHVSRRPRLHGSSRRFGDAVCACFLSHPSSLSPPYFFSAARSIMLDVSVGIVAPLPTLTDDPVWE